MISALTLKEAVEFAPFKLEENLKKYEYGHRAGLYQPLSGCFLSGYDLLLLLRLCETFAISTCSRLGNLAFVLG